MTETLGSEIAHIDRENAPQCSDLEHIFFSRDNHVTCNFNQVKDSNSSRARLLQSEFVTIFLSLTGLLDNTVIYSGLVGFVCGYCWVVDFNQNCANSVRGVGGVETEMYYMKESDNNPEDSTFLNWLLVVSYIQYLLGEVMQTSHGRYWLRGVDGVPLQFWSLTFFYPDMQMWGRGLDEGLEEKRRLTMIGFLRQGLKKPPLCESISYSHFKQIFIWVN